MSDGTQARLILDAVQDALREFSQRKIGDHELSELMAKIEQIIKEHGK